MEKTLKIPSKIIKIIAVVCMFIDHMPYIWPNAHEIYYDFPFFVFHFIGRIAAPIFFYSLATGFKYSKNRLKYALRLLIFALISYFPFIIYFHGVPELNYIRSFLYLNVIFTMLFGLMFLTAINKRPVVNNKALDIAIRILMILTVVIVAPYADYGYFGIVLICVFYYTLDSKIKMGVMTALVMALNIFFDMMMNVLGLMNMGKMAFSAAFDLTTSFLLLSCGIFLSIPLLLLRDGSSYIRPKPFEKYFFYIFYPLHISIFLAVTLIFFKVA